jgi:hypothetical protein
MSNQQEKPKSNPKKPGATKSQPKSQPGKTRK